MTDTVDRYIIDVSQLKDALRQARDEAATTEEAFEELSKVIDASMKDSAESAEKTADGVEHAGDKAKDAGDKGKQGGESFKKSWIAAAGAAAAATAAVTKLFTEVVDMSEELNILAKRAKVANTSIEEFQKVQGVFDLLTEGGQNASTIVGFLNRNIDEARQGTEAQAEAFERLNIDVEQFAKLPLTEQLAAIADGMQNVEDHAARTAIASDLLGRAGKQLVPAFEQGGQSIRDAAAQIEKAGLISTKQGERAEQLQDSILLLKQAFAALKADVLDPLVPKLAETADEIQAILAEARESGKLNDLGDALNRAFTDDVLEGLTDAVEFMTQLGKVIDIVARGFGFLQSSASFLPALVADLLKMAVGLKDGAEFADDFKTRLSKLSFGLIEFKDKTRDARVEVEQLTEEGKKLNKVFPGLNETFTVSARELRILKQKKEEAAAAARAHAGAVDEETESLKDNTREVEYNFEAISKAAWAWVDEEEERLDRTFESQRKGAERYRQLLEETAAEERRIREESAAFAVDTALSMTDSLGQLFQIATNEKIESAREGTEAEKKEALKAWEATKAFLLAQAAIETALAVITAVANTQGGWQAQLAAGIAAGAAGAVAIAAIAAEDAPVLHGGGMVEKAHSGRLMADEQPIVARVGEGILTAPGVAAAGGAEAVAALNRGQGGGGTVVVVRVGDRTTEALVSENIRHRDGAINKRIRETQPRVARYVMPLVGV